MSDIRNYERGPVLGTYDAETGKAIFTFALGYTGVTFEDGDAPGISEADLLWLLGQRLDGWKERTRGGPSFWAVLAAANHVRDASEALDKATRS